MPNDSTPVSIVTNLKLTLTSLPLAPAHLCRHRAAAVSLFLAPAASIFPAACVSSRRPAACPCLCLLVFRETSSVLSSLSWHFLLESSQPPPRHHPAQSLFAWNKP